MVEQVDREALEKIWYEGIRAMHPDAPPADEAILEILAAHRLAAEKAERDRIVAWLRLLDHGSIQSTIRESCADAIEGGEHLK